MSMFGHVGVACLKRQSYHLLGYLDTGLTQPVQKVIISFYSMMSDSNETISRVSRDVKER